MRTLTILAAGNVRHDDYAALSSRFESVNLIPLAIPPGDALDSCRSEVNRAIDASANGWIVILREGESIDGALAGEMSGAASDTPVAWGFRVRVLSVYRGHPLRLGMEREGEIRLLHRRHCRFDLRSDSRELKVEGPVLRLNAPLHRATFGSAEEHRAALERLAVPHSLVRRVLVFARNALVTGAWKARWTTLQYLWIEAGYDHGERAETRSP